MSRPNERLRTFTGGERDLETPVDSLGRIRHKVTLDRRTVVRADGDATTVAFHGHAAVFDKRALIGGKRWGFWEKIAPGAFAKTIGEADVRFLINHDPNLLMARNKSGTLTLSEDATGLVVDAPNLDLRQTYTNDFAIALERGDISQMSFAFEPIEWRYEEAEDGKALYTLTELRLFDVAGVTYPAYEETDAGLRALGFEAMTRSLGLDATEVLERMDLPDLGAYLAQHIASRSGAEQNPGPVDATRNESLPAESTGAAQPHPLALRMLSMRTSPKGNI